MPNPKTEPKSAASKDDGNPRKRRGRRGGRRNGKRKKQENEKPLTPVACLEKEWFHEVKGQPSTIPPPFSLGKSSTAHEKGLIALWQKFSQQKKTNVSWKPRPIQTQSWSILLGKDARQNMIGLSPTASGKTLAFGAPMVVSAALSQFTGNIFGLVLVPTRELAQQVARELERMIACCASFTRECPLKVLVCCGGDNQVLAEHQCQTLCQGKWLVSATPGRFLEVLQKSNQSFQPNYIVLDESDRLATNTDLGQQVTQILEKCLQPSKTKLAFFSATYPHKAQERWKEWMILGEASCLLVRVDSVALAKTSQPENRNIQEESEGTSGDSSESDKEDTKNGNASAEKKSAPSSDFLSRIPAHLVQTLHVCAEHKKARKLVHTLDRIRTKETQRHKRLGIVFFARIKTLQYISKLLQKQSNHKALELHSQLPQPVRNKAMQSFQAGKVPLLLATDIAARGLHVSNVSFIINYDFPPNLEQYVHRTGRAGRNPEETEVPPTIYSFFTRSMAPMAPDLIALLEACNAWIDPNLRALVEEGASSPRKSRKEDSSKEKKGPITKNEESTGAQWMEEDESESFGEDAFPEFSANRVVLKRASHVSDASSSESEDEDKDEE